MKKTILVVDDFDNTRFVIEFTLRNKGYEVLQASNGNDALKYFDGRKIDLLITDLNMPKMDGIELTRKVRGSEEYGYIPILLLTTETDGEKKEMAQKAEITGWIQKPYKIEKFVSTVTRCLGD